jgi:hypothetical protein
MSTSEPNLGSCTLLANPTPFPVTPEPFKTEECHAFVARAKQLSASCTEVDARGIEGIYGDAISQHGFVSKLLRHAARERLPRTGGPGSG